jgi:hypothetical protein
LIAATLLRPEHRRRRATERKAALQVHVDHLVPLRLGHLPRRVIARHARVAHQAIEPAQRPHRRGHCPFRRGKIGHVGPQGHGLPSERAQLGRQAFGVVERAEVHQRHVASFARQFARDRRANAAPGTRHQRRLPRQVALHRLFH